ncbi:MAG: GspE/PulE family protein, partial [Planctomycetota bacterium]
MTMSKTAIQTRLPLGQVLLNHGVVTQAQIDKALERQKAVGHSKLLGELLVELEICTDNQICSALAEAYGVPYAPLTPKLCDPAIVELLPRDFLEEYVV